MGLAAPKNRSRISKDPQNTTWANNTSRFGHRILTSQGWTPGTSLGADAAHAEHYTAASHSHIRVFLKEDNLGLGAKRGSEKAENFGLAGLASILGRLNGNEEEVKKEEERQEKIQQKAYAYRKYGFMNFVSGGFLVGDKITRDINEVKKQEEELEAKVHIKPEPESSDDTAQEKKSKKRKRSAEDAPSEEPPKLKRKKKSVDLREEAAKAAEEEKNSTKSKKDKKEKKEKKSKKSSSEASTTESPASAVTEPVTDKARRKAERRARKEEKQLKKALKKAAKEAAQSNPTTNDPSSESEEDGSSHVSSLPTTGTSTPKTDSGLTFSAGGRHAVRQRYIRQKKMALMDPQALKEIFMIKTPS